MFYVENKPSAARAKNASADESVTSLLRKNTENYISKVY